MTVTNDEMQDCVEQKKVALFCTVFFLKRIATKSRGSRTTTTNAEVILIQTNMCEVIEHVQFNLFHVLGHEKEHVN